MTKAQKKATNRAPAKKAPTSARRKGVAAQRRDGSGHVNPAHAARLLKLSREGHAPAPEGGFVPGHHSREPIAEELGEGAVSNMTSGEDSLLDALDENVDEEHGGPFVETSGAEEFADGTDASNIAGATREPFPKTSSGA